MLGIDGTAQHSRIAYRIFILFMLSAIIPIGILAVFSLQQLSSQQVESVEIELRKQAKSYGLLLNERLGLLDEKLKVELKQLSKGGERLYLNGFSKLYSFDTSSPNLKTKHLMDVLKDSDINSLRAGNAVLLMVPGTNQHYSAYLLREYGDKGRFVVAKLDSKALWGSAETFDLSKQLCVYGANNTAVFCPTNEFKEHLNEVKSTWDTKSTGVLKTSAEAGLYVAYWKLFTQANYSYPGLMITISTDQAEVIGPVSSLRNIFIIISVLVLVIIILLSTFQIRRYFSPLKELMKGIRRISKNDFNTPVIVETKDEFSQLANSFNLMSTKVSGQIEFLSGIAAIDQHILSSRPIKGLLPNVVKQLQTTINFERVGLVVLEESDKTKGVLFCDTIHELEVELTTGFITELDKKAPNYREDNKNIPSFLKALKTSRTSCFIEMPIVVTGEIIAVLVFGFADHDIASDVNARITELGKRFALAFEKSAWDKKLYKQAHYDPLTGLPNRELLNERLEQAIIRAARNGAYFSLMFLDLDRFKVVNDTLGHTSGDELLTLVANRLVDTLREEDTVARQGGDEFIILLSGSESRDVLVKRTSHVATKLLSVITEPYELDGQTIHISTSIGIALFPIDGKDGETLVKHADSAMYHVKSAGKNNFQLYSSELNTLTTERLKLESELYLALLHEELELYYQPKVDAKTGEILGAEALIRWNHPVKGLLAPGVFISIAEETGLIGQIGEWTIQQACRQINQWQEEGLAKLTISVNLSVAQFQQHNLVQIVSEALENERIEPCYLDLEILEDAAMDDMDKTVEVLEELKALGVKISIDDYGTGYSTLSYIKKFPIDNLKIDMSFIRGIIDDDGDQAIVASTILLADKLGLNVVVEGVEEKAQFKMLQKMGCNEIQGYYFSPPVSAKKFAVFLREGFANKITV